jgi:hypothetical protein
MARKLVYCIILICVITGLSFAQAKAGKFALFAGVSLPVGDFGDNSSEGDGYATTGFGGGIEYTHPIGTPGLGWYTSGSFLYNGFDDKGIKELAEEAGMTNPTVDAGSWISIPILTGLKYEGEASSTLDFFIFGQVGLDFVMPPDADVSEQDSDFTANLSFDSATSFSLAFGGGLVFSKKFNVSIRYLSMGEPKIEGTVTVGGEQVDTLEEDIGISVMLITLGLNL